MNILVLLMIGCTPQDAELTDATYHVWLAENSSGTIDEGELSLKSADYLDCSPKEDSGLVEGVDYLCPEEVDDTIEPLDQAGPNYWLDDDAYYVMQGKYEPWRSEALMNSEGDFQLTVHHDLGDGQDFRFAFAIDPVFQPSICIQENQTCYNDGVDDDGDGLADFDDPDCLYGGWEVGFDRLHCNDGVDNDGDGAIDLDDSGCDHAFDAAEETVSATCSDDSDNDSDGWIDDDDPDCAELGQDEDGRIFGDSACNDGIDNDGDGFTDADDAITDTDGGCITAMDNDEAGFVSYDACADRVDNDGDGWTDAADSDCTRYLNEVGWQPYACNDGVDNDSDGDIDADDVDCLDVYDNNEDTNDTTCDDGADNDGDGWADADDPDCIIGTIEDNTYSYPCAGGGEADCESGFDVLVGDAAGDCTDGGDEDGDGWFNTDDPDCSYFLRGFEYGYSQFACNDGVDNDIDGFVDAEDGDCLSPIQNTEDAIDANCLDESDNDGDGWIDFDDADCMFGVAEDGSTNDEIECADGIDNDGNGAIDAEDSDNCSSGLDSYENSTWSCEDGIDNDGDGYVDNAEDPDCAERAYEFGHSVGQCTDGADNDGDGDIDGADSDCVSPLVAWEEPDQCSDGADNDGDGWTDNNDPGCLAFNSPLEDDGFVAAYACNDGNDNDGNGLTDHEDPNCEYPWDNIEAEEDGGAPIPFVLNYGEVLEEWSTDEDGYTIYYLNAGAYQVEPSSEGGSIWSLPQEWRAGYGHAKFAAEEFDSLPTLFGDAVIDADDYQSSYVGTPYDDPSDASFERKLEQWVETAGLWSQELVSHGMINEEFSVKLEDNAWRPVDIPTAGLDNWIELNTSWVRIKDGADFAVDGQVEGDYQIYFLGRESSSSLVVRGSFKTTNIREDRWGYSNLEDDKFEENGNEACEF